MKSIIMTLTLLLLTLNVFSAEGPYREKLVLSVKTEDARTIGMAFLLGRTHLRQGKPAVMILGANGVKHAVKDRVQEKFEVPGMISQYPRELVASFISEGGEVIACGACFRVFNLSSDDVVEGVSVKGAPDALKILTDRDATVLDF